MGGVVKVGNKLLVHPWAVYRLLNIVGRCPHCGRHWDDKLVLRELQENERKAKKVPQFSVGGLRDGLRWREKLNELVPEGGDKFTFEDVKRRPSIFGKHGRDKASPEEHERAMRMAAEQSAPPPASESVEGDPTLAFDADAFLARLRGMGLLVEDEELGG